MRLKSIWISEYKNLKNFELEFDGQSFIDVFVGKNGTGKSNLFEALIEIFRHLYEFGPGNNKIGFDYGLKLEIDGKAIEYFWEKNQLTINGKNRKSVDKALLPVNVLIYYSGHNTKVAELVRLYEKIFKDKIKSANIKDTRSFIGIGQEYKQLLLAVLLLQPDGNRAKQFVCEKLGIKSIANEVKIVLKRPFYARSKGYEIEKFDEMTRYWHPQGITKDFLDRLSTCKAGDAKGKIRDEGYFPRIEQYADEYILYFGIADLQLKFAKFSSQEFFRQMDNLKTIEMLKELSIEITLDTGIEATTDQFSDGQFQSVYIYSIVELFKDRNCITLLDEPDSFLHPEWQFEFLKQVLEIAENEASKNHVLMSSHSAITLISHCQKKINLFHFADNRVCCHTVSKSYAINQLSSNILKYSEDEQILSTLNRIRIENKPVVFTEGSTDAIILNEAWHKLYKGEIPFIPIFALNCVLLKQLLQDERILKELDGNVLFGLFDFDDAYNEWNHLKGTRLVTDPYKGMLIDVEGKNSFAFMLPVPEIEKIEKQVVSNKMTKETFCHKSKMAIEHLFYGDPITHPYFEEECMPGGGCLLVFKESKKTIFAQEVVPKLDQKHFEVFRPMFDFIKSKC